MIAVHVAESFIQSPVGTVIVSAACAIAASVVGVIVKMMVDMARLVQAVDEVRKDIKHLKGDSDVMRWSELDTPAHVARRSLRRRGDNR